MSEIFKRFLDSCDQQYNGNISYFDSLQYIESVVFIIGYGHITPTCAAGKVCKISKIYISHTVLIQFEMAEF